MSTQTDEVRRYYDANTPAFRQFGHAVSDGVIRRAIWGPGVANRSDAFRYVDGLIASTLRDLQRQFPKPFRVFDFGCGFGASLLELASTLDIEGLGVTISAEQARVAQQRFASSNNPRLRSIQADFLSLPEGLRAHLIFSIEAFVHSPTPQQFFEAAAQHIEPGGVVVVCDDFLTERAVRSASEREGRWIAQFQHGWVAPSTVPISVANEAAEQAGFELQENIDLTPYLELRRPRDRALALAVLIAGRLPIPGYRWRSLVGGHALQMSLRRGLIEHRYVTWKRRS